MEKDTRPCQYIGEHTLTKFAQQKKRTPGNNPCRKRPNHLRIDSSHSTRTHHPVTTGGRITFYFPSIFTWAYLEDGLIVWDDESLTPADASSFCVLDDEIIDGCLLRPKKTAVTTAYFRNAERLVAQDQRRETKYYEERQEKNKKKAQGPTLADVQTKEGKADFTRKCKVLQDAAATRKQKVLEGSGTGAGKGSSHNMNQD
ncbi:hypothetical protein B0H13DRAFT_2382609 [Mycena leptocephala]|nr:hypothetical protein B0H13DRAFT_2382609 [Mycena leptocephala]